ncbi:MAG: hypothetical protein WHS88_11055 [Anaerohalosphaeraceae bacterium]
MFLTPRRYAMTLLEVLVTLAVVLLLFGTLSGLGVHLKRQSEIRLTESTLAVLATALEQYYNDYGAYVPQVRTQADFNAAVGAAATRILPPAVHWTGTLGEAAWSSEALYYFLNRSPNSKAIIGTLLDRFLSNKDATGRVLLIEIPTGSTPTDLIRFVDVWGMPIRYEYDSAVHSFPILTSAGPDKMFETAQDNVVNPQP